MAPHSPELSLQAKNSPEDHDSSDTAHSTSPPTPQRSVHPEPSSSQQQSSTQPVHKNVSAHRLALRPALSGRNNSTGKIKVSTNLSLTRPGALRAVSGSLTSPTLPSPRTANAVKRNSSGVMTRGTASALKKNVSSGHLAHLPRHGSSKAVGKYAGTHGARVTVQAPAMKRSRSSRSEGSQKSPIEDDPDGDLSGNHTVRFDLEDDEVKHSEGKKKQQQQQKQKRKQNQGGNAGGSDNEDNEWTEESASVSPETTRDHTRSNSLVLDPSNALGIDQVIAGDDDKAKDKSMIPEVLEDLRRPSRNNSDLNMPSADAMTSRMLGRGQGFNRHPQRESHPVTSVTTLVASPNPSSYVNVDSFSPAISSGSTGPNVVSRFIHQVNGLGSNSGTPTDGPRFNVGQGGGRGVHFITRVPSPSHTPDNIHSRSLPTKNSGSTNQPRRSRSPLSPQPGEANSVLRSHIRPGQHDLPLSRTQQRLELERQSTVQEANVKNFPPVALLTRHPNGMPMLYHGSLINAKGAGAQAQIQGLYGQVDKEYEVVKRFRKPLDDALRRLGETRRPKRKVPAVNGINGRVSREASIRREDLHPHHQRDGSIRNNKIRSSTSISSQPHSPPSSTAPAQVAAPANDSPAAERSRKKHSRVSWDLPVTVTVSPPENHEEREREAGKQRQQQQNHRERRAHFDTNALNGDEISDDELHADGHADGYGLGREAQEVCRRMWDLSSEAMIGGNGNDAYEH